MRPINFLLGILVGTIFSSALVFAWTGPTSAPPDVNVSAPINVGTTDQVKNSGLAVNVLAVFGDAIMAGVSSYLNFGSSAGAAGYGFRDNAGIMQFKDDDGSWTGFLPSTGVSEIAFADGSVQTSAATTSKFGDWSSRSFGTNYRAATDGFVVGYSTNSTSAYLFGYTDGNAAPSTRRTSAFHYANTGGYGSIVLPVRAGDSWRVDAPGSNGGVLFWLPLAP